MSGLLYPGDSVCLQTATGQDVVLDNANNNKFSQDIKLKIEVFSWKQNVIKVAGVNICVWLPPANDGLNPWL